MAAMRGEPKVFFPWEKRRGVRSLFGWARARQGLRVGGLVVVFVIARSTEQKAAQVRATRAEISTTTQALSAFRADHDRACPGTLSDLVVAGYIRAVPRDAWGKTLQVTCPGRRDPAGFDVSSDGPDGEPGGTDRVE